MIPNAFVRKLQAFTSFSAKELHALNTATDKTVEGKANDDLIVEGDVPRKVHVLLEGWAYRYKILPDGSRQIMAYLLPGDICDAHVFILNQMDHSLGLLSDAKFGCISEQTMGKLIEQYPNIRRALFWSTLTDEAILRQWLINTLRRYPYERMAHLLCELWTRMKTVGMLEGDTFDLPLTQTELGDTLGLNAVTINRVLQRLRAEDLITLKGGRLNVLNVHRLMAVSEYDPSYLHLDN